MYLLIVVLGVTSIAFVAPMLLKRRWRRRGVAKAGRGGRGYDGYYYLCSSDREKQVAVGNVFDDSLMSIMRAKLDAFLSDGSICRTCCHDPVNRVTFALRTHARGLRTEAADTLAAGLAVFNRAALGEMIDRVEVASPPRGVRHRRIRVTAAGG